jgi:hypothetical protein
MGVMHVYPGRLSPIWVLVPVVAVLVVGSQACAVSNGEYDTRRVSILNMGALDDPMIREPFLDVHPVFTFKGLYDEEVIRRSVRLYMPRTYEELVARYGVLGLNYNDPKYFTAKQIKWLSDAILEGSRGLAFYGHGANHYSAWLDTTIAEVLPVEKLEIFKGTGVVWIEILKPENPFISSIPWSEAGWHGCFEGCTNVKAKTGSEVLAEKAGGSYGTATPFITWWEVGEGRCLAITGYFKSLENSGNPFTSWEYYPDFVRNYHLYAGEREIPSDPVMLHRITVALEECQFVRGMLISLTEFVSSFGGNPNLLYDRLDLAEEQYEEVFDRYLEYEFEESLSITQDMLVDLEGSMVLAMELKNRTMLWIYLIQWSVLTCTGVLSGTIVWILMVRRRLYREVEITKLDKRVSEQP